MQRGSQCGPLFVCAGAVGRGLRSGIRGFEIWGSKIVSISKGEFGLWNVGEGFIGDDTILTVISPRTIPLSPRTYDHG